MPVFEGRGKQVMASFSRGLLCVLGAVLLMAGPAARECPAGLLDADDGDGQAGRDEYTHHGIAPLGNPFSYAGSGFDVAGAGYWGWAFGDLSARFDLGYNHGAALSGGASEASFSPLGTPQARPGSAPDAGQEGVVEGMLRAARDSLLDNGNTANFSFAGIEVSLKGGSRSIMVNGYDVLPAMQTIVQRDDAPVALVETKYVDAPTAQAASGGHGATSMRAMLADLEAIALHPMTLFIAGAMALGWLFARAWSKIQDVAGRSRSPSRRR